MQVNITGIATKGYKDEWFKSYNIRYYDGSYWYPLRETEFPFLPKVGNNTLIYTTEKGFQEIHKPGFLTVVVFVKLRKA